MVGPSSDIVDALLLADVKSKATTKPKPICKGPEPRPAALEEGWLSGVPNCKGPEPRPAIWCSGYDGKPITVYVSKTRVPLDGFQGSLILRNIQIFQVGNMLESLQLTANSLLWLDVVGGMCFLFTESTSPNSVRLRKSDCKSDRQNFLTVEHLRVSQNFTAPESTKQPVARRKGGACRVQKNPRFVRYMKIAASKTMNPASVFGTASSIEYWHKK